MESTKDKILAIELGSVEFFPNGNIQSIRSTCSNLKKSTGNCYYCSQVTAPWGVSVARVKCPKKYRWTNILRESVKGHVIDTDVSTQNDIKKCRAVATTLKYMGEGEWEISNKGLNITIKRIK